MKINNLPLFSRPPVREKSRAQLQLSSVKNDCSLFDGAAIVNMLRSGFANTFTDYATEVFLSYTTSLLQHVNRLDVVWNEYIADSLKAETRTRRRNGIRRRVEPSNSIPANWQEFLRINDNKTELFSFLGTNAATFATDKQVISICHTGVLCTQSRDVSGLLHAPMKKRIHESYSV